MRCPHCGKAIVEDQDYQNLRAKWIEAQKLVRAKYGEGAFVRYSGWRQRHP